MAQCKRDRDNVVARIEYDDHNINNMVVESHLVAVMTLYAIVVMNPDAITVVKVNETKVAHDDNYGIQSQLR